jgi:hypothetical protein
VSKERDEMQAEIDALRAKLANAKAVIDELDAGHAAMHKRVQSVTALDAERDELKAKLADCQAAFHSAAYDAQLCSAHQQRADAAEKLLAMAVDALTNIRDSAAERGHILRAAKAPYAIAAAKEGMEKSEPVCSVCNDTHRMQLGEHEVMCTHCPVPCSGCRIGAYCENTPCGCPCHFSRTALDAKAGTAE